jgi:hypothetical protein
MNQLRSVRSGASGDRDARSPPAGLPLLRLGKRQAEVSPSLRRLLALAALAAAAALLAVAASSAASPTLRFRVFSRTGIALTDVLWTGKQFLLVENTKNDLHVLDASGKLRGVFADLPKMTEETRCVLSPGTHGFPADVVYCHTPDNKIYRISPDGQKIEVFATLPETATSDGALDVDRVGLFGYGLVAATGRSGAGQPSGGAVYVVDAAGDVRKVGSYDAAGADEVMVAPKGFGSASGQALLTSDAGDSGSVVAMDARGRTRTIAQLDDGPNPIVEIGKPGGADGAQSGFYVVDTLSKNVYFLPAEELARYAGKVLVASELKARFWLLEPDDKGFKTTRLATNLRGGKYNLEGGRFLPAPAP